MMAPAIPITEASITTHFQQYVLFNFIVVILEGQKYRNAVVSFVKIAASLSPIVAYNPG